MAFYDYRCGKCEEEFEVSHGMNDEPNIKCPKCKSKAKKMPSICGIVVHGGFSAMRDSVVRRSEAKQDLLENYGVENVTPLGGETFDSVYKDIKDSGTKVNDKMQKDKEIKAAQSKAKRREWGKKANKRVGERTRTAAKKKAQEAATKRAVSVSS